MYDLIVIGAGSGGLTAVNIAHELGAKVALVEKDRIGGDCTWTGCVPSKSLLHVARTMYAARQAQQFGAKRAPVVADMVQVKAYVQQKVRAVYEHERPETFAAKGIDLFFGEAKFLNPQTIQVNDQVIAAKKFLLATGAHPFVPPIAGLAQVPYLTHHQIFENDILPNHLLVLGAGPVGMELSQAYGRFGATVTIVDEAILPREGPQVAALLQKKLSGEGVHWVRGLATAVTHQQGLFSLSVSDKVTKTTQTVTGDMLLVAVGRRPNVNGLDLDKAGVEFSEKGIQVNDRLQTTARHIYAAGDCVGGHQFTHFAGWQAYKAVRNALLPGNDSGFSDVVPRVTFTDPEVAQVGLTESEAKAASGKATRTVFHSLKKDDRAQADDATVGFVQLVLAGDGRVLGATIVAPRAGEMIAEIALAMQNGLKVDRIAHTIHPYPTYTTSLQLLAAAENMSAFKKSRLGKVSGWLINR